MLIIVLALITVFTYYISVVKEQAFRGKFLEMAAISMSVAALSFLIGYAVKVILRIDL
jgi:VIT1/CCC1 family predicted Fe2+/Mn2+ transporter